MEEEDEGPVPVSDGNVKGAALADNGFGSAQRLVSAGAAAAAEEELEETPVLADDGTAAVAEALEEKENFVNGSDAESFPKLPRILSKREES
jgi:hypothetical protein